MLNMTFCNIIFTFFLTQSFPELKHKPQLVDLTVEEGQRLKVIYGSTMGFHAIDLDSSSVFDLYIPSHVSIKEMYYQYKMGLKLRCFIVAVLCLAVLSVLQLICYYFTLMVPDHFCFILVLNDLIQVQRRNLQAEYD